MDVVARGINDVESDCVPHHEGYGFRFELSRFTRVWTIVSVVQHVVRVLVSESGELHRGRETVDEPNVSAARRAQGAAKIVNRFERNALPEDRGPEQSCLGGRIEGTGFFGPLRR